MIEAFYTAGLALLESTFVFVGLLILHGLRRIIGSAPLYMFLGVLVVMMNLAGAARLRVIVSDGGFELSVSTSILLLPVIAILLVIYIADGTLAAQRLIIAAMATVGIFAYLSWITRMQTEWGGFTMSQGHLADYLSRLLGNTTRNMGASLVSLTLDLFLIPMIFQKMKNYGCRLAVCAIGAVLLGQFVGHEPQVAHRLAKPALLAVDVHHLKLALALPSLDLLIGDLRHALANLLHTVGRVKGEVHAYALHYLLY